MNTLQGINTKSYTGAVIPLPHNHQRWSGLQRNYHALSYHPAPKTSVIRLSSYSARTFASYDRFNREARLPSPPKPTPFYIHDLLKVSHAVVSFSARTGENKMEYGSGTIIHRDGVIITSAVHKNCVCLEANDMVDVTIESGESLEGSVLYADAKCNIAIIKITPETSLPTAELGTLHDVRLGEPIFILGRDGTFCLKAVLGTFSGQHCGGPFREFLKWSDETMRIVDGGPVVNLHGEVVGVNFFNDAQLSLFVPIGIIAKCLEHVEKFGKNATNVDAM